MPSPHLHPLDLADWRRRVAELYAELRTDERAPAMRLIAFRTARDPLFAAHPASPVPLVERRDFRGVAYFPYRPELALRARLEPDPTSPALNVPRSGNGLGLPFVRIGWVTFTVEGVECRLSVFWLDDYAGGIFIPFRDTTSGQATYGGGRYLWDSAKGADLGTIGGELVLDFNYAYHPSCVYDPIWSCPLAPRENWLAAPVNAGERLPESHQ
jgi:uncharacterized protein (DUF1684 family)